MRNGKWRSKVVEMEIQLQQFDAKPGIEAKAYDLGIDMVKIKNLIKDAMIASNGGPKSRKQILAEMD